MEYQVIIPMTGVGQRFVDAGYSKLKPLILVEKKSIVSHVLSMFTSAQEVVCIVNREHVQIEHLVREIETARPDAKILRIPQHKFGPGHAIYAVKDHLNLELPTIVAYCDWAGIWNVNKMLDQLKHFDGSILTYTGFHPHMLRNTKFAYVCKSHDCVIGIQEKMSYTDTPMNEDASAGCYGFASGKKLISALANQIDLQEELNGEFYISLTYKNMIRSRMKIGTVPIEKFFQWGTPEDLSDWNYWRQALKQLKVKNYSDIESHNIVLAAGRGSRIGAHSVVSKPNINVLDQPIWEFSAPREVNFINNLIITRPEVGICSHQGVENIAVDEITEGQAITALIGIKRIEKNKAAPVNILSCDNAFPSYYFRKIFDLLSKNDIVIWTSSAYPLSQINPDQYSWINKRDKKVIKKQCPPNFNDWEMIIGNFSFKSVEMAENLIEQLVDSGIRINNEFYLDSIIELAFQEGLAVETYQLQYFFAVGTVDELNTYKYYADFL